MVHVGERGRNHKVVSEQQLVKHLAHLALRLGSCGPNGPAGDAADAHVAVNEEHQGGSKRASGTQVQDALELLPPTAAHGQGHTGVGCMGRAHVHREERGPNCHQQSRGGRVNDSKVAVLQEPLLMSHLSVGGAPGKPNFGAFVPAVVGP
eukprot:1904171-Lingulodinium_polyedra.AAC.1